MARKASNETGKRTLQKRTKVTKSLLNLMSGGSKEAFSAQTSSVIQSIEKEEREEIISNLNAVVTVPADHVASMKATMNLPWYQLREIKRWLKTFNINLASEKKTTRKTIDEWVGEGLKAELAPLVKTTARSKRVEIIPTPWVYIYNLVAHVLKRLSQLKENNLIFQHCFIAENEIHIKIGPWG